MTKMPIRRVNLYLLLLLVVGFLLELIFFRAAYHPHTLYGKVVEAPLSGIFGVSADHCLANKGGAFLAGGQYLALGSMRGFAALCQVSSQVSRFVSSSWLLLTSL